MIIKPNTMQGGGYDNRTRCARCEKPIIEKFFMTVQERTWHCCCLQCVDCGCTLEEKCFERDGQLYCSEDFFRRFGTKCAGCGQGISPNSLVRRAKGIPYHLECFICAICRKQLATGEEMYVENEKFMCKEDYITARTQCMTGSDGEEDETDMDQNILDKLDDNGSDKVSSFHDDDSIDSGFPPMSAGLKLNHTHSTLNSQSEFELHKNKTIDSKLHHHPHPLDLNNTHNPQLDIKIKEEFIDKDLSLDKNDNPKLLDSLLDSKESKSDSNSSKGDGKDSEDDKTGDKTSQGQKRRGPRTTIKAKQLDTLKAAFAATPKPTRHIREQLAQETGLNMRVIQVWFQNRRSKERRMKQLNAMGARRNFFRGPRRMRGMGDETDLMGHPAFGYFGESDFYGNPGFPGGYPGAEYPFHPNGDMGFLPPGAVPPGPPMMDPMGPQGHMHDAQFGLSHADMMPPPPPSSSSTPDTPLPPMQSLEVFAPMPPRSVNNSFSQQIHDNRPPDLPDGWL